MCRSEVLRRPTIVIRFPSILLFRRLRTAAPARSNISPAVWVAKEGIENSEEKLCRKKRQRRHVRGPQTPLCSSAPLASVRTNGPLLAAPPFDEQLAQALLDEPILVLFRELFEALIPELGPDLFHRLQTQLPNTATATARG